MTKLEQFDYAGATALALVMLAASFALLIAINGLTWRARQRLRDPDHRAKRPRSLAELEQGDGRLRWRLEYRVAAERSCTAPVAVGAPRADRGRAGVPLLFLVSCRSSPCSDRRSATAWRRTCARSPTPTRARRSSSRCSSLRSPCRSTSRFGIAAAWAITRFQFPASGARHADRSPFAVSPVIAGMIFVLLFGAPGALVRGRRTARRSSSRRRASSSSPRSSRCRSSRAS